MGGGSTKHTVSDLINLLVLSKSGLFVVNWYMVVLFRALVDVSFLSSWKTEGVVSMCSLELNAKM